MATPQQHPPARPPVSPSLGSEVYTGVATFGRFRAVIGAILGVIIALVLIIIGIMHLRDPHTAAAPMTVTAVASCVQQQRPGQANAAAFRCVVTVAFAMGGRTYTVPNVGLSVPAPLVTGATIVLRYDPANPASVVQEGSPRLWGWGLIGGGILFGGIAVGAAALALKSKGFAAVEGTVGLIEAVRL